MDAILAQTSSQTFSFIYTCTSKAEHVFCLCLPLQVWGGGGGAGTKWMVTKSLLLPISRPCFPRFLAPPKRLVLLLTGVICASGIDAVCLPIKIFEGNVYFLERIAPAACKLFWIRPFMCKNLPLWGVVQDLSVTECWFGHLQRKWRSSRGSKDLTQAESSVAPWEKPNATPFTAFGILLTATESALGLIVFHIVMFQQRKILQRQS